MTWVMYIKFLKLIYSSASLCNSSFARLIWFLRFLKYLKSWWFTFSRIYFSWLLNKFFIFSFVICYYFFYLLPFWWPLFTTKLMLAKWYFQQFFLFIIFAFSFFKPFMTLNVHTTSIRITLIADYKWSSLTHQSENQELKSTLHFYFN